jgi:acyl carrier protein
MDANELLEAVSEALEVEPEELDPETVLEDLPCFDSVMVLSLMVALDEIGVEISQNQAAELATYGDIMKLADL